MPQKTHVMHGRDHLPGGADPIPNIQIGAPASSLEGAYLTLGGLEAWYRLGEAGPWPTGAMTTASFMLDSSGNGRHLTALNRNAAGSAVLFPTPGDAHLPTCDVAGALSGGDPVINDGGIRFNWHEFQWTTWGEKLVLESTGTIPSHAYGFGLAETYYTGLSSAGFSVTCWVKSLPYGTAGVITDIAPYDPAVGKGQNIFGDMSRTFGVGNYGTRCSIHSVDSTLTYYTSKPGRSFLYTTTFGLIPDRWYFLAMTLERITADGVTPALYTRRLLLNGTELTAVSGDAAAVGLADEHTSITLGGAYDDDLRFGHGAGAIDEFSVWSKALTDIEMFNQMTVKVENEGDIWMTVNVTPGPSGSANSIQSGSTPEGATIVADGEGGTEWGLPLQRVYVNGA